MNKKNLKNLSLIFTLITLFSCQSDELAKLKIDADGAFKLNITDEKAKIPITFLENEISGTSALWFESDGEKTWITGKPEKVSSDENQFSAAWIIDDKNIIVRFVKNDGNINFSFSATPDDNITGWGLNLSATPDEFFTGLFERVVDGNQKESWKEGITEALNLRGQKIDMLVKPTVSLYTPFHISSNGYGIFFEGTWPGHYDFCNTNPDVVSISFEGKNLSGIIYTNPNPAEMVKAHSLHVGPTIVPPKWAFLPWRWRDNHENRPAYYDGTKVTAPYNSMLVEDMLMMKAFDIPCGVYWVDRPWAKGPIGYDDFEWDEKRLPNPQKMIDWLHNNDTRFLLWVAPWVTGNMRSEALEKGYAQPLKGSHYGYNKNNVALIDFTNPEACKWLQEKGFEKMLKQGVDGFKLDRAEELVPETNDIILSDGRTAREVRNQYPVLYVKTVNEACRNIKGDDFVLIPRAGYTGSSKYSGFWGGDIGSPPEGLRSAIIAVQRCAVIGFPIWGSDIGGYWQGDLDREVTARWLAFGCFNPIMEFGPTEDRAPWYMDSEPGYDTELIAVWRLYAKIHTMLAGYSHQLAVEANQTGMPIVRPLFLQYPDQPEAWKEWQTYMYGPDILVSALWEKGQTSQQVFLPEGEKWIDAWDKSKTYEGGQTIEVETPYEKIPIFIRQGSEIDLGDLNELYRESIELAKNKPDLRRLERNENF
ncbi:MAG: glycoside hydrolase family 31 protein [Prolixibacteraceae bacterium]|nr:glycoside hydrolase family 31 protein [Prolixibacteraceae bacterium]